MDIIIKGRHTEVPDRFREHAAAKLAKIERLDHKAFRVDVELSTERNPRQAQRRERVELTIASRGPVVRAEAAAEDRFAALDIAFARLESRLRRACDRRKDRHAGHLGHPYAGGHPDAGHPANAYPAYPAGDRPGGPGSRADRVAALGDGTRIAGVPGDGTVRSGLPGGQDNGALPAVPADDTLPAAAPDSAGLLPPEDTSEVPVAVEGEGPLVVREKFHAASPMTIDQALFEMELVGHDFFLYRDAASGLPSVVYRRRGYQYGVLRLVDEAAGGASAPGGDAGGGEAQLAPRPGVSKS